MSTLVIGELFDRRAAKLVSDGRYHEDCANKMIVLKDKENRTDDETTELKRLQGILAAASRETATDFILKAVEFPQKERDLVTKIQNCLDTQVAEKARLKNELAELVHEYRSMFLEDALKEQDKAKKPKISSRSKVTRKKKQTKQSTEENEYIPEELGKPQEDKSSSNQFTYKRKTHFEDTLRRASGKASDQLLNWDTDVTNEHDRKVEQTVEHLVKKIGEEMKMSQIPTEKITPKRVRQKLKKLGGSQYFEFSACVAVRLNPKFKALELAPEHEAVLLTYFAKLEPVFDRIKREVKSTRNNFMSYPNTAYKLCEMLGQDEENKVYLTYMKHFSPLKSEQLQIEQDEFWELCCTELDMPFYRTVGNAIRSIKRRPPKRKRDIAPKQTTKRKRESPKSQFNGRGSDTHARSILPVPRRT
jgi:hypothetical protein